MKRSVLMVVTSCDAIDAQHPTGLWLEEFVVPWRAFLEAGFEVAVASPKGGKAPVDPGSMGEEGQTSAYSEALSMLEETLPLVAASAAPFDAVFLPGGHGTMFDLAGNERLAALLEAFAAAGKVIAAVCHGPCGLLGVRKADGTLLVAGKRLTAFTDDEEREVRLDRYMPFLLEGRLRELGSDFVVRPNWEDHVEVDGRLVTGQNPQSSASTAAAVIRLLEKG